MQGFHFQKMIKKAWLYLLIAFIFSCGMMYLSIGIVKKDLFTHIVKEVNIHHEIMSNLVDKFKNSQEDLLTMLVEHPDVKSFNKDFHNTKNIEKLFYNTAKAQKKIMQVRFIDTQGYEKFRVDQDRNNTLTVVPSNKLQNKSNRYYVQEFLKLKPGEIGYSEFDLNIEKGKIERPFNPTLRIAKGVYSNHKMTGIIVINFFMQDWIKNELKFTHVDISMIDKNGYFTVHSDPSWAWSKHQIPAKKAIESPFVDTLPDLQNLTHPFYTLNSSTIGKHLKLFSDDVLVAYRLKEPIDSLIIDKVIELSEMFILVFLPMTLAFFYLIYRYIDLTKQNNLFLDGILNNMFDALILIDKNAIIHHVNQTTLNLFGYTQEELIGQNIKMLVPEPHKSVHDEYVKNYKHQERTIIGQQRNISGVHKDTSEIPISLAVTKTKIGDEDYFIGTARDLSEVKKLEAMAKSQEAMLIQQSKLASMGEMVGAIAHQWRQPLNELTIRIQKLKYNYLSGQINEEFIQSFIAKNKQTINFMSGTIDDFRNFFRIDKEKHVFSMKESLKEVISLQNAQLKHHNISISLAGEDFQLDSFKTEFQQVIINLISNSKDAFVARKIKEPQIIISLKPNEISIQDNAGGIKESVIQRVFEPYFTTKDQGEGTGMGLYLSKMIVEQNMHGIIKIQNKDDGIMINIDFSRNTTNG